MREAPDPFLNAGAPGVVNPDQREAVPFGEVHEFTYLATVFLGETASHHGEVLAVAGDPASVYFSKSTDDTVPGVVFLLFVKFVGTPFDQTVNFLEGVGVEEVLQSLVGGLFAPLVLLLNAILPASFSTHFTEALEGFLGAFVGHRNIRGVGIYFTGIRVLLGLLVPVFLFVGSSFRLGGILVRCVFLGF
jgi:hypothetical protein